MSWRAYETLRVQPDFSQPPDHGIAATGRQDLRISQAEQFSRWVADTQIASGFRFRIESATQLRQLREFLARHGGSAGAFMIPSWVCDYRLAKPAEVGDTEITIEAAGLANLVEDRPDTEGRVLFAFNPARQLEIMHVASVAADEQAETETLTIDTPLSVPLPSQSILGVCRLMRLASDDLDWLFYRPGFGRLDLRMIAVRNTLRLDQEEELFETAIEDLQPFVDVIATDEEPTRTAYHVAETKGPTTYDTTNAYTASWIAAYDGPQKVTLIGPSVETSQVFDGTVRPEHLGFGFDAGGREFLAWTTLSTPEKIRCGYWNAGSVEHREWAGYAPVAVNTFAYDSTADTAAADAEGALFYLKPGSSTIWCRLSAGNFATEYVAARSPVVPIYLHEVRFLDGYLEVVGMDAGHRLTRWRFGPYLPPLAPESVGMKVTVTPTGEYRSIRVVGPDQTSEVAKMKVTATPSGEYKSIRKTGPDQESPGAIFDFTASPTGEYRSIRVVGPDQESPGATFDFTASPTGEYRLIRLIGGDQADPGAKMNFSAAPTGTYEPAP